MSAFVKIIGTQLTPAGRDLVVEIVRAPPGFCARLRVCSRPGGLFAIGWPLINEMHCASSYPAFYFQSKEYRMFFIEDVLHQTALTFPEIFARGGPPCR